MQTVFSYIYLEIQAYIYVGESFQSHNLGNIGVRKYWSFKIKTRDPLIILPPISTAKVLETFLWAILNKRTRTKRIRPPYHNKK